MRKFGLFAIFAFAVSAALILFACSSRDESSAKTPAGLKATVVNDFVEVVWNKVEGAAEYKVYRKSPQPEASTSTPLTYDFVLVSTQSDTSYLDIDVSAAKLQQYLYRVSSLDANGKESPMTNSVMTRCAPAAAPANVHATSRSGNGLSDLYIDVTWSGVIGATSYKVYYSDKKFSGEESEEEPTVLVKTTSSNSLSVRDGLLSTKYYYFRVKAVTTCGESEFSDYDSASTGCLNPKIVNGFKAEALSDKAIKISWEPVENATEYILNMGYRNKVGSGIVWSDDISSDVYLSTTSYTHNLGGQAVTVYYRLRSVNDCGVSNYSAVDSATTKCLSAPDDKEDAFKWNEVEVVAHAVSKTQIDVAWQEHFNRTVTGYEIFHSATGPGNTFKSVGRVSGRTNTSFEHKDLKPGTDNFYKIRALNDCGAGSLTANIGFDKTLVDCDEEALSAPTGLAVVSGYYDQAQIYFDRHPNADYYKIYRSTVKPENTAEGRQEAFADGLIANNFKYNGDVFKDDLIPNTTYYYSVKAVNSCGESDFSPEISVKTDCIVPTKQNDPFVLSGKRVTESKATLSWSEVRNAESYEIYRSVNGGNYALRNNLTMAVSPDGVQVNAVDTDLDPVLTYVYYVVAVNSCGKSESLGHFTLGKWQKADCDERTPTTNNATMQAFATGANKISLYWNQITHAAAYNIYRGVVPSASSAELITKTSVKERSYDDEQSADGTTHIVNNKQMYYYWLSAIDSCGKETKIDGAYKARTAICQQFSAKTSDNVKIDSTANSIKLTWEPVTGAQKYIVNKYLPSRDEWTGQNSINYDKLNWESAVGDTVGGTTKTFAGLNVGTVYWFKITAINHCGDKSASYTVRRTNTVFDKLDAVAGLEVTVSNNESELEALYLTWNKLPNGAAKYIIYRSESESGDFRKVGEVDEPSSSVNKVSYTDRNNLQESTTYWYIVTAMDERGNEGKASDKAFATTRALAIPAKPTIVGVASDYRYTTAASMSVSASFSHRGFRVSKGEIEYSLNNSNWTPVANVQISGGDISMRNEISVSTGSNIRFRARVTNDAGTSEWSDTKTIYVACQPYPEVTITNPSTYDDDANYIRNVRIFFERERVDNYTVQYSSDYNDNYYNVSSRPSEVGGYIEADIPCAVGSYVYVRLSYNAACRNGGQYAATGGTWLTNNCPKENPSSSYYSQGAAINVLNNSLVAVSFVYNVSGGNTDYSFNYVDYRVTATLSDQYGYYISSFTVPFSSNSAGNLLSLNGTYDLAGYVDESGTYYLTLTLDVKNRGVYCNDDWVQVAYLQSTFPITKE